MRPPRLLSIAGLFVAACAAPPEPLGKTGSVQGLLGVPPSARGDAYVFLYPAGEGPPLRPAAPAFASGVSDTRIAGGDTSYVLASVPPNPYHLWAFLDANRTFRAGVDVLDQPGAGGRTSDGADLDLQPGQSLSLDLAVTREVELEPPAFTVGGSSSAVQIPDLPTGPVAFTLTVDGLGILEQEHLGFAVALPAAGDPIAGSNPLGVPTVYPQIFLRFLPKPGQVETGEVILPLLFDPSPYLATLAGQPAREVVVSALTGVLLPQAQQVTYLPGGRQLTPLPQIPIGDYELWVLQKSGQFWKVPNALGAQASSQAVQFSVFHGSAGG